jgi:hypothetical protein
MHNPVSGEDNYFPASALFDESGVVRNVFEMPTGDLAA